MTRAVDERRNGSISGCAPTTARMAPFILGLLAILLTVCSPVHAVEPDEILKDAALETRARAISQKLRCVVTEVDREDRNLLVSRRAIQEKDREEQREKFQDDKRQEIYQTDLAARRAERIDERPCASEASVFFTRLAEKIESLGATPIFVTQPALNLQADLVKARRQGLVRHLLRYDDPDEQRCAALFEIENRWDKYHLAESGARIFTEMLARDFAELADSIERPEQQP